MLCNRLCKRDTLCEGNNALCKRDTCIWPVAKQLLTFCLSLTALERVLRVNSLRVKPLEIHQTECKYVFC